MHMLIWETEEGQHRVELDRDVLRLGRGMDNDIRLLARTPEGWFIEDLASKNGVRVAGHRVQRALLRDGDRVLLGDIALLFVRSGDDGIRVGAPDGDDDEIVPEGTIVVDPSTLTRYSLGRAERTVVLQDGPADMLEAIVDVAQGLLQIVTPDDLFDQALDLVLEYLPVSRAFLLLYDKALDELVPKMVRTRPGQEGRGGINPRIALKAFRECKAILTRDAPGGFLSLVSRRGETPSARSVASVPLFTTQHPMGVLYADMADDEESLQPHHLHFLTLLAGLTAGAIEQLRLRERLRRESDYRERLMRYQSPAIVERLLGSGEDTAALAPRECEVTVLFADLVGFSTWSEPMAAGEVVGLLNEFFSELVDAIFEFEGTLDKFLGDAVMAVFGAPNAQEDHALRAVRSAVRMFERLGDLNRRRAPSEPLRMRIAINSGPAVAGDIGSSRRLEYTVLGTTVNVAARFEAFVAGPGEIVFGPGTYEAIRDHVEVESLGEKTLEGIRRPVMAYRLTSVREPE
jgi:adenylate cyclase